MSMVSYSDLPAQTTEHDLAARGAGAAKAAAKTIAAKIALFSLSGVAFRR